ncbi:LEAF RUST 10 DISEASE-RESISTANCE LOCUS RECEPTOR-LIKE PROTEIN KINASE-like 2.1 isoform X3 [Jatropha curcas]|uniref:LEAF RUST 10 DISEASE-RESISTANCE LOCUS RECEPTOR-LIKE PROTEIN KINASE-like 2.1 isoform X3 n=1 Tax=Jatropha curcas TaxID=180498 RepID=UPI0018947E98|nr:LEAF RUST 10 DISEASE-RESISTANCE LOCUS RECEPTOR-LIKE PROTEIN KINASE-like 2.1 isoform X3 [Jatropha curcas]
MDTHLFLPSHVHSMITLFFLLLFVSSSYCEDDKHYTECRKTFSCGNLHGLYYPFWSDERSKICGDQRFKLRCEEDQFPVLSITNQDFRLLSVDDFGRITITIVRMDLFESICPVNIAEIRPITIDNALFLDEQEVQNVTLFYNCSAEKPPFPNYRFSCDVNGEERPAYYATGEWEIDHLSNYCNIELQVPISAYRIEIIWNGLRNFERVLKAGFNVVYKPDEMCERCSDSSGICGTNSTTSRFTCLCHDRPYPMNCPNVDSRRVTLKVVIGIVAVVVVLGILVTCGGLIYCRKKIPTVFLRSNNQDFEAFLENHGPLSVKRYSFSEVKKMTNFFKDKLGQGGYGIVYKGKLKDGHFVAVKVLNASKGEGEEFINEVASISRTSHINIVTLLGFCLEGQKRALIYEFISNGSLENFICSQGILKSDYHLGWEIMHEIAIGIARGLEYLHRGCKTRIVHFDIKPHNILLDENFCPKISDFGLAKLYTKKESILSMLETRGTIGYIAPEVFSRNFGGVSYKSDVYSYGMLVLETVGGREKDEVGTNDSSNEKYFPYWIYKRIELGNESKLYGEIKEIVRKMTLVGLWCIQTNPSDRPSMSKVIEMLEGSSESLKIPPMPLLFSTPESPPLCSFTTSTA